MLVKIKWVGTVLCLIGMALTSFNIYPSNLWFGGVGSAFWAYVGLKTKDSPMITIEIVAVSIYLAGLINWVLK